MTRTGSACSCLSQTFCRTESMLGSLATKQGNSVYLLFFFWELLPLPYHSWSLGDGASQKRAY